MLNFSYILNSLKKNKTIAYPTESMFGLGCDPDNEEAILNLLTLKKRPLNKGLIIVSGNYQQLLNYIDIKKLNESQKKNLVKKSKYPITWVVPAQKRVSKYLKGKFNSLAVRIIRFKLIKKLCLLYKKPIVSTSANLHGFPPCRTQEEVMKQFSKKVDILPGKIEGNQFPSKICDILTGYWYRK